MTNTREKLAKWLDEKPVIPAPDSNEPGIHITLAERDELLSLLGDGEPVAWVAPELIKLLPFLTHENREKIFPKKTDKHTVPLYLHAAPVEQHDPIGYVEEDDLPLMGRSTLHQEPNASRVAVYREAGESRAAVQWEADRGDLTPQREPGREDHED